MAACRLNREETQIDALAKEHPDQLSVFSVDIGRDGDVRALCEAVGRTFPCLDLVINCAGILGVMDPGPDGELDYDLMLRVFNVNALGTLRVTPPRRGASRTAGAPAGLDTACPRRPTICRAPCCTTPSGRRGAR